MFLSFMILLGFDGEWSVLCQSKLLMTRGSSPARLKPREDHSLSTGYRELFVTAYFGRENIFLCSRQCYLFSPSMHGLCSYKQSRQPEKSKEKRNTPQVASQHNFSPLLHPEVSTSMLQRNVNRQNELQVTAQH